MRLGVWQFLPLGPTGYGDSPYQLLSSFAGNEMLIDLDDLVADGLLRRGELSPLPDLPATWVDYGRLIPVKTRLLARAASRFEARASAELKSEFDAFRERHHANWLRDYALFRLLKTAHDQRPWPEWATQYARRDASALRSIETARTQDIHAIEVLQFLFYAQWRRLREYAKENGVRLFGDLPIYVALDSADAWTGSALLRMDAAGRPEAVAGVPPDYFSDQGQLWGNPLYDWPRHEATGYAWWIARLRAAAECADIVRIDHFRGFESYWAVAADSETARDGQWEPGPGDKFFDAVRRALGSLPIVAENLGVITPEVESLRSRHHLPGMVVLQFAVCEPEFALSQVPVDCVCYTGTHDNDTTVGWFNGGDGDTRSADEIRRAQSAVLTLTRGTPATVAMDLVKAAFSTDARLAVAPLQDYLGLGTEARLNTPGTLHGNWRWRVTAPQLTDEVCDNVANAVTASGREPPHGK